VCGGKVIEAMLKTRDGKIRLFNGDRANAKNVVGFCYNKKHKGAISKKLMNKHGCLEKGCRYFERMNDSYWEAVDDIKMREDSIRAAAKQNKVAKEERDALIRSIFSGYPTVHITSIKECGKGIHISYIYSANPNLTEAVRKLKKYVSHNIYLIPVQGNPEAIKRLIHDRVQMRVHGL
jgi:hypothetical protein